MSNLSDFLGKIRNIQSLMVQVSTGKANIEQKEPEYQKLREDLTKYYSKFRISDPNNFVSLRDFYGYWRTKLPTYQARRVFISNMYEKLENSVQSAIDGRGGTRIIQLPSKNSEFVLCNPIFKGRNFELEKDLCFVLMPFRPNFKRLYEEHIRPILEKAGFRILKADDLYTTSAIVEDIWEYINKARLIIADVTSRNPNVFYELGIAHTLGKETVILTQNEKDIPFNLSHLRHFKYDDNEVGWKLLRKDLQEIVTFIKSKPVPIGQNTKESVLLKRIKDDLILLKKEITLDLENEAFQRRAFPIDIFKSLRQDLIRDVNTSKFRAIQETYTKINQLRYPSTLQDDNMRRYKEAIEAINKTLRMLE